MKAARYYGKEDVRVEDIPIPDPEPNECLVEVEWAGICGTDLHEYLAGTRVSIADAA
jgi:(R,R)-butanediol dehydrogenase / meso-butanediol dehydrogenase / diacetyl reductase